MIKKRINLVNSFSHYITGALTQVPPGSKDGLRPDGTAWRDMKVMVPATSFPAFKKCLTADLFITRNTFLPGESGWNNSKKAMISVWIYSNPEVGLPFSGKTPS